MPRHVLTSLALIIAATPAFGQMGMNPPSAGSTPLAPSPQNFQPSTSPSHSPMTPVQIRRWKACQVLPPDIMANDKKCLALKRRAEWQAKHGGFDEDA